MITVHVWMPRGANAGHASASVKGSSGQTYVSWWPESPSNWGAVQPGHTRNFDFDVRMEGQPPTHNIAIRGLNEARALDWWTGFTGVASQYDFKEENCCWVVVALLTAGGADRRISMSRVGDQFNFPDAPALGPVMLLVMKFLGQTSDQVIAADTFMPIWTPADVVRYATAVNGTESPV